MKILHVTSNLDPRRGGPVSALVGLANAQAGIGEEVCVLVNQSVQSVERGALENSGVDFVDLVPPLALLRPQKTMVQDLQRILSVPISCIFMAYGNSRNIPQPFWHVDTASLI